MKRCGGLEDSNNISIGIHFFKVLVQIHYSLQFNQFNQFMMVRFNLILNKNMLDLAMKKLITVGGTSTYAKNRDLGGGHQNP